MSAASKNVYMNKLDEIVVKYNKACYKTIKIKLADIKQGMYIGYCVEHYNEDLKLNIGDNVGTLKYKNIFEKRQTPN